MYILDLPLSLSQTLYEGGINEPWGAAPNPVNALPFEPAVGPLVPKPLAQEDLFAEAIRGSRYG